MLLKSFFLMYPSVKRKICPLKRLKWCKSVDIGFNAKSTKISQTK